jgi:hypothetical protein
VTLTHLRVDDKLEPASHPVWTSAISLAADFAGGGTDRRTQGGTAELESRAAELLAQLGVEPSADPKFGIAPKELATTIVRTLNLPAIAAIRTRLVPEHTVFGSARDGRTETLVSGIVTR